MHYKVTKTSTGLNSYQLEDGHTFSLKDEDLTEPLLHVATPTKFYTFNTDLGTIHEINGQELIDGVPLRIGFNKRETQKQVPKPKKSPVPPSFRYMTIDELNQISDKDRKENKINQVKKHIEKALQSEGNFRDFLYAVGYPPQKIPTYENVQSIEIEGDNLVINEFASDPES